ncbi:MAG: hypothetical protein ACRD4S_16420 [Candidatus Acidiferrales bacterium]
MPNERPRNQSHSQTPRSLSGQWNAAVLSLASKIAAATRPSRTLTLEIKNISTFNTADIASIREALVAELERENLYVIAAEPTAGSNDTSRVQLTFSENVNGYLWVVEIQHGGDRVVEMVPLRKPDNSSPMMAITPLLQRKVVWIQAAPILDFAQMTQSDGSKRMLFLEPVRIRLEWMNVDSWQEKFVQPISPIYVSRGLRGRLVAGAANEFKAHVAGTLCTGSWDPALIAECKENAKQEWPIVGGMMWPYLPSRNFFLGATTYSGSIAFKTPSFFSAAFFEDGNNSRRLFAEPDGTAELFSDVTTPAAAFADWGSDIASIQIACDSNWYVLVTGAGDWTQPDQIQTYEIVDNQATAVGQPLLFPGPILALWTADDGKSARIVSRNLKTGMYEASIVSATCGN